jgi:outer membrane protein assembly factor BamB
MVKHLQIKAMLLMSCLITGCGTDTPVNYNQEEDEHKPLWIQELPGEAGIYNDGLIGFPVYQNQVFFHSTYFTGKEEDNRIHALDMNTGEIKWTFPKSYKSSEPMFFSGYSYLNENYLAIKMPQFQTNTNNDRIICINPENQELRWKINIPDEFSQYASRDVSGVENKIWFFQQGSKSGRIYEANLLNGDTVCIYRAFNNNPAEEVEISSNYHEMIQSGIDAKMVFSTTISEVKNSMKFKCYLNILNLNTRQIEKELLIEGDNRYSINSIKVHQNKIFLSRGITVQCYDYVLDKTDWIHHVDLKNTYASTEMLYADGVVFMWGTGGYYAFNATNGELIYQSLLECGNADVFDGIVYIAGQNGKLYLVDIKTGQQIREIKAPNNRLGDKSFSIGAKPQIHGDKLYMFTRYHAVCYKLEELLKK